MTFSIFDNFPTPFFVNKLILKISTDNGFRVITHIFRYKDGRVYLNIKNTIKASLFLLYFSNPEKTIFLNILLMTLFLI
jgi:hypothetical protein